MKKLRLLLFKECNRNCIGCCNQDWNLDSLPIIDDYSAYDEIMITGGEPMLAPGLVNDVSVDIRHQTKNSAKLYLYTAKFDDPHRLCYTLSLFDGVVITIHEQSDVVDFIALDEILAEYIRIFMLKLSLRLNVFSSILVDYKSLKCNWKIKKNIKWIKNLPLPENEIFGKFDLTEDDRNYYFMH